MSNNNLHRSLASGLFWVVLANLVVKPFWILGIDRGVQNAVGATEYGLYFVVFNLAYIFNILLDLGVTNFNTRNIARHPQLIQKHLSGILSIKFLLLGLYLLVTLTAGLLLGYEGRQFRLLLWLCANQFLNSLITYLRSNFEGLLLFRWDSLLSVMDRLMMIVICGFLLWGRGGGVFRIEWFVYAQTAAYLLTLALAFIVLARRTGLRRLHFSRPFTWAILKQSAPFALLVLLMASYNRLDPVLLQRLLPDGAAQAGIYAGAFRLLDALTMVAYLVSVPLLPIYARLTKHTDTREIATITGRLFALMMVFALTAAVVLSLWAYPWMGLMYEQHVFDSAAVFRILVWGIVPISTTYIFGTLLTANGSLRQLNLLATISLVLNVVVNLLLIPRWGAVGAAWASLSAQSFIAVAQIVVALRLFRLKPTGGYVANLCFFVVVVVAAGLLCLLLPVAWWLQCLLVAVVAVAYALMLKIINLKEIKSLLINN